MKSTRTYLCKSLLNFKFCYFCIFESKMTNSL